MGCLDNLIGIRSCSTEGGSSPYFIEDLGITTKEADFYINSYYASGKDLIEDKIAFSTRIVKDTIANHFSSDFNTRSLISSQNLGQYQDNLNLKAGAVNTLGGINLSLLNDNTYLNVFINSISLQIDISGDTPIYVYDLVSGTLLDTFTATTTPNVISTVIVNKLYSSPKRKLDIIIVYDTENINCNTTYLSNEGCTSCNGYKYWNSYITSTPITILESDTKIRSSLRNVAHTAGLSINYSVQCAMDNWLCDIANLMALPILYKTGAEIMSYASTISSRQNSYTNIDAERNAERLAQYNSKFLESLNDTLGKIVLPKYNECFSCSNPVKLSIVLP